MGDFELGQALFSGLFMGIMLTVVGAVFSAISRSHRCKTLKTVGPASPQTPPRGVLSSEEEASVLAERGDGDFTVSAVQRGTNDLPTWRIVAKRDSLLFVSPSGHCIVFRPGTPGVSLQVNRSRFAANNITLSVPGPQVLLLDASRSDLAKLWAWLEGCSPGGG
ncbi:MAG: hypothetical protein JXA57_18600 [Armatimonadetes bacterium]|nr:hypothetical protein [Armatimonadota bacterium]